LLVKVATAATATGRALRPGIAARRVMRVLHLGGAWNQFALWLDRRQPALAIDGWSAPLVARPGLGPTRGPLAGVSSGQQARVAEVSRPMLSTAGADGIREMRCLLMTPKLNAGGMQEVVAFLARRLPSQGWQTAVLCTSSDALVEGHRAGLAQMLRSAGIEVLGADARQASEWAQQWRPDVISAHGAPAWAFTLAARLGVPYVDNLHNLNGLVGRDWRWHTAGVRSGTLASVVAVSDVLRRQQLACNPGFPPDRVVTIPNGVDSERLAPHDRSAVRDWLGLTDQYLFVSLGRYCMQKNIYGLVTAFGDVAQSRPDAHLVFAGRISEPRYYRRVLQLRDSMWCRDRIHLRDNIESPAQLLAAADGFVLGSFFEGWPLASMESLATGLPVVITDVSGAREQVGGEPARGYVVSNPLGNPLAADWASSAAAQYSAHANRDELASAMETLVLKRDDYLSNRDRLAAESAARFSSATWLRRHDAVLRAAATGATPPETQISGSLRGRVTRA
jgi:glycosyltransferase involved in cell wall biosynthesis